MFWRLRASATMHEQILTTKSDAVLCLGAEWCGTCRSVEFKYNPMAWHGWRLRGAGAGDDSTEKESSLKVEAKAE